MEFVLLSEILPLLLTWTPVAVVGYVALSWFRSWYRLHEFNGPWLAGLSEGWLFGVTTTGKLHMKLHEVNNKYGIFSVPMRAFFVATFGCADKLWLDQAVKVTLSVSGPTGS